MARGASAQEAAPSDKVTATQGGAQRWALLSSLAGGHAVIHWFQSAFPVLLAEMKVDLGLSPVAAGAIQGVRSLAGGVVNVPAGFISDTLGRWRALILVMSMVWISLAYLLVAIAPTFLLLLCAVALVGMGGAWWHPPALATLSARFPERRGFAFALHGMGGSVGDILGPLAMGALLALMAWQMAARIGTLPAVALAVLVWLLLRGMMAKEAQQRHDAAGYFRSLAQAARHVPLLVIVAASGLRSAGQITLLTFFPIYLREDLGMGPALVGFYVALVTGLGLASQPVLGWLSDRVGRKAVVVPGLAAVAVLTALLPHAGSGLGLIAVVAAMGLFVYALSAIILTAGMDITQEGLGATTVGAFFSSNFVFSAAAPIITGVLVGAFGIAAAFYAVAALFLAPAFLIAPLRLPPPHRG